MDKIFTGVKIAAIATALPKERLILSTLAEKFGAETVSKIIKSTEISELRIAPAGKTSADYCLEAARKIFDAGIVAPSQIDGIIFVTETPNYRLPHTSAEMQAVLGVPHRALTLDINYGCAGYVYGLFVASLLLESSYCRNVLLCAGDMPSKYVNAEDKSTRLVLGDGGSATILTAEKNSAPSVFTFYTDGENLDKLYVPVGGFRAPSAHGVTDILKFDENGNGRTLEDVHMDGMGVMNFVMRNVKNLVAETLSALNLSVDAVDLFAMHQANALIVKFLAKKIGVGAEKMPFAAQKTGNTTCATIPLLLSNLYAGRNENLRRVLVCGFGTGLTCAAGVIDLSKAKIFPPVEI
ncbi:MAG: ketoacyl-ACP synthase III [Selenomonadaceae bacterium]|nr:ketoacyl-ACP synthase III [Selenomonadaceae bacterium]